MAGGADHQSVGRDALAVEIILTDSISDASTDNHSITAFSDPTYTTLTRSYARKISYGFTESPNNPAFEQLWSLEYIDTTDNETVDRCTTQPRHRAGPSPIAVTG